MDKQVFEQRFMKIISTFGAKNYSAERVALIYAEVKAFSVSDLEKLINHMVGNQRFAPLLGDFKKVISEMGFRPEIRRDYVETTFSAPKAEDDYLYHLRENYWADNKYIHVRGKTLRECGFIIKSEHPGNPLVIEDCNVREQKIKEVKLHLVKGTYPKFEQDKNNEMRRVSFENFSPEPA